jgi:hypothetical protein
MYLSPGRSGLCWKIAKKFVEGYAGFKIFKFRSRLCRKLEKKIVPGYAIFKIVAGYAGFKIFKMPVQTVPENCQKKL